MKPRVAIQSIIITVVIIILSLGFFTTIKEFEVASSTIRSWIIPINAFTIVGGLTGLVMDHLRRIIKKEKFWRYSILVLITLGFSAFTGFAMPDLQKWINSNISSNITIAFNGLYFFFLVSGAYRAFRIKNVEALLLLTTCAICLMVNAPIVAVYAPWIQTIGKWIIDVPGMAVFRGLNIGVAIGIFALAIRTMLGQEKTVTTDV